MRRSTSAHLELPVHSTNISDFLLASKISGSALVRAYLGLVAIELALKSQVSLPDHDVGAGLTRFKSARCKGAKLCKEMELTSLIGRLRTDLQSISVNGKDGKARSAPQNSYPFLRYTRHQGDGWPAPNSHLSDLERLARTVQQIRTFLRQSFGLPL